MSTPYNPRPLLLSAVRALTAEDVTPEQVLSYDPSGTDDAVKRFAGALEMYQAVMETIAPGVPGARP